MAVDPYDLLTRIEHASDEIDRLDRQISRLSADRCRHEQARNHAVAAIDPLLAKLPPDAVVELHGVAYWTDPDQGFCSARVLPWTELTPAEEPEPIHSARSDNGTITFIPEPQAPSLPACAAPHCLNVVMLGEVYCEKHWPDGVYVKAPELTPEQETEAARFMAMDTILHTDADEDLDTIERELAAAYHLPVDAPRHLIAGEVS